MNAITSALSHLRFTIPIEVLHVAFHDVSYGANKLVSLDENIMTQVIRPKILVDANLVSGEQAYISLSKCNIEQIARNEFLVDIPKELTDGRYILSPQNLMMYGMLTSEIPKSYNNVSHNLNKMYNAMSNISIVQTSKLQLVGDNLLIVKDPSILLNQCVLQCRIENPTNLTNLHPRTFLVFNKLVEYGVKAYIYTSNVVRIDQAHIYAGHEIGTVTDIINGYSDMHDMYQEYLLTTASKAFLMNNANAKTGYIKSLIGHNF